MRKLNRRKLYSYLTSGGLGLSIIGTGSFLANYVASSDMSPLVCISSVGVITLGGLSTLYGTIKQNSYYETIDEDEDETYDNIYDLDLLELRKENLKKIQTRFDIEKTNMDKKTRYIISRNILKEKLLIKKVLEELDTDIPSVEEECNIIVSMILDTSYDDEYLEYKEKVLSSNIVEFPNIEKESYTNTSIGFKVLQFPKKQ